MVLQKEFIKFKIKQRNDDVKEALLKINTFFPFIILQTNIAWFPLKNCKKT